MRIFFPVSIAVLFVSLFVATALADPDIDQHRDCRQCGMDRKAYGFSRMLVEFKDGRKVGTCSLHCAVIELNGNKAGEVVAFKVAERNSRRLIDAETAFWVIGGSKRGVMTMRAKWAFATEDAARTFVNAHGGSIASWSEALAAAREDAAPKPR